MKLLLGFSLAVHNIPTLINAHGALGWPPSRQWICSGGTPPNLGVEWGGKGGAEICQPGLYGDDSMNQVIVNWSGVGRGDAQGRSDSVAYRESPQKPHISDMPGKRNAKICSGGKSDFSALDRVFWTEDQGDGVYPINITVGTHEFMHRSSVPHRTYGRGYLDLYLTKDNWNPTVAATWDSIESQPFCRYQGNPSVRWKDQVKFDCKIPKEKTNGKHIIYAIWQREDSPEAFYSCSDIILSAGSGPVTQQPTTPKAPYTGTIATTVASMFTTHPVATTAAPELCLCNGNNNNN